MRDQGQDFFGAPVSVTGARVPVQPVSQTPGWPAHLPISSLRRVDITHCVPSICVRNNNTLPRLAGLTYLWGSVASQFLTLVGELAGEARS